MNKDLYIFNMYVLKVTDKIEEGVRNIHKCHYPISIFLKRIRLLLIVSFILW